MTDLSQEVTQLFPQGKEVTLKGKPYVIKPFGFGKFPKVLALFKQVKDTPASAVSGATINDIFAFVTDNSDVVIEFAVLATGEKKEFFDDVPLDEAVELVQAVIEVNADFFVKRLQPKIMEALEKLTASVGGALSQPSSQPAIASAT